MADVQGNRHHDRPDAGSPVKIGGRARTSAPTDVTADKRVDAYFDPKGRLVIWAQASDGSDIAGGGGGGDGAINDGDTPTIQATVFDYTSSNPIAVRLTDTSGDYTAAGGGSQYTEGDTDATITGTAIMWEDAGNALVAVSAAKPIPVNVVSGSSAGTEFAEDAAHVSGALGTLALAVRNDGGATLTTTDGDYSAISVNSDGSLQVTIAQIVDVMSSSGIDVYGTVIGGTNYNIGSAGLLPVSGVRNDSAATTLADTNGDYSAFATDDKGRVGITDLGGTITVDGTVAATQTVASTGTTTSVSDSATSTTLLASNGSRLGATITNDSSARLYVKMGATASTTSYAYVLEQFDTLEAPFAYTGIIDGIWATDPGDGAARVTEFTT